MRKNKRLVCSSVVLIIALNLLVYANTLKVPFQFDDVRYIEKNKDILYPLDINGFATSYFLRGIVRWSYAVNYLIGKLNTIGYHIVNLLVHIIISVLFFVILRNLYPNSKWNLPLLAALLFSLHPIQIESVTYLMSRAGLLATFFYLLAFYFFINSTQNFPVHTTKTVFFSIATLICFFLGLGSKLTIATLPIMLIIYLFVININKISIFSVARQYKWLLVGVLAAFTLFSIRKAFTKHGLLGVSGMTIEQYGRWGYFMTEVKAFYSYYLKLLLLPINFNINPDFPFPPSLWQTICLLMLTLLGFFYLVKYSKKLPLLIFSVLWVAVTLSPTSSIVPLNDLVAEHRIYLPSLGFFIAISLAIVEPKQLSKMLKIVSVLTILIVFSILTVQRNSVWNSAVLLWEDAVKKSPHHVRSHLNLGRSYYYERMLEKAVTAYEKANNINAFYFVSHFNLGTIYYEWENLDKAAKEFSIALQLNKNLPEVYINLGNIYMDKKEHDTAIDMFKAAIHLQQDCSVCFRNIAIIYYYHIKDYKKAMFYFKQTLRLDPEQNQKQEIQSIISSLDTP
jgi:tetratricopeptide (TPR) repeat protein